MAKLFEAISDGNAIIRFSDAGPGIPQEKLSTVFDRFERATSRNISGCGVGNHVKTSRGYRMPALCGQNICESSNLRLLWFHEKREIRFPRLFTF